MLTFEHLLSDFTGHGASRKFTEVPETCPLCHHHVDPRRLTANATTPDNSAVDFAFQCPRADCRRVFVGRYRMGPDEAFELLAVAPNLVRRERFSAEIQAFSPAFVEVYDQAQDAEGRGHHQLAGIGLRKALELLVKDHAADARPDQAAEIRALPLAACLERCVDDPGLRACAARAAALAGDETAYLRQWTGRDLDELKLLVRLAVNWVENVLLARRWMGEVGVPGTMTEKEIVVVV